MNSKRIFVIFVSFFILISIQISAQSIISPSNNSTIYLSWGQTTANITFSWTERTYNHQYLTFLSYEVYLDGAIIGSTTDITNTSLTYSTGLGNHTWFVRSWQRRYNPYYGTYSNEYYDCPSASFIVRLAPPKISYFDQSPDPMINGQSGYVYVHLSQGLGTETYSWYGSMSPSNGQFSITPEGNRCRVEFYSPYSTPPTIYFTCVVSNSQGTDVKSFTVKCASWVP